MPLQKAVRTGGDFLDLRELAGDGEVLCVFRIREFHQPEKASGFDGLNLPVIADVLVASGPRKGEVHLGERFIGSITSTLRGVRNPRTAKGEQPQPPETGIGDEIVARIKIINKGKANAGAVGDVPSDAEMAAVEEFYGDGKAIWDAPSNGSNGSNGEAKIPAQAGAGGKRPW